MHGRVIFVLMCLSFGAHAAEPVILHGPSVQTQMFRSDPIESWNGFFLGALAGYDWDMGSERVFTPSGVHNWRGPLVVNTSTTGGVSAALQLTKTFQSDIWVWGGELEGAYVTHANWRGRYTGVVGGPFTYGTEQTDGWMASVRAKFGIAMDRWLVYALVGPAIGSRAGGNPGSDANGTLSTTLRPVTGFGFVVGGGVEFRLNDRLNLKLEYAYTALNSRSFSLSNGGFLGSGARYSSVQDGRNQAARIGLNVRLR